MQLLHGLITLNKSHKFLIVKDNMWHQVAMVVTWRCNLHELFIHLNQLIWHHHLATNFMTKQCSHIIYIYHLDITI
jgi:hypothetical protein